MPEASRLLITAFALERVWHMLSARADQTLVEGIARAGMVPFNNGTRSTMVLKIPFNNSTCDFRI
jgi:hypothetical protein